MDVRTSFTTLPPSLRPLPSMVKFLVHLDVSCEIFVPFVERVPSFGPVPRNYVLHHTLSTLPDIPFSSTEYGYPIPLLLRTQAHPLPPSKLALVASEFPH